VLKREVKEEYMTHAPRRSRDITICEPTWQAMSDNSDTLRHRKPAVKAKDQEVDAAVKIATVFRQQRLEASSDDLEDTP
jgi:hypothetical protein